ncbi:hypothetical protein ACX1NB_01705 [Mycoplasma sp. HF14]
MTLNKKLISNFLLANYIFLFVSLAIYLPIFLNVVVGQKTMSAVVNASGQEVHVVKSAEFIIDYLLFIFVLFLNCLFTLYILLRSKNSIKVALLPFIFRKEIKINEFRTSGLNLAMLVLSSFSLLAIGVHTGFFFKEFLFSAGSLAMFIVYVFVFVFVQAYFYVSLLIDINVRKTAKPLDI